MAIINYFVSAYKGEPIHILRNGRPFMVSYYRGITNQLRLEVFAAFGDSDLTSSEYNVIANINKSYYGYNSFQFYFLNSSGSPILDSNGDLNNLYYIEGESSYMQAQLLEKLPIKK
jgi:hypothetical protein